MVYIVSPYPHLQLNEVLIYLADLSQRQYPI